MPIIEIAATPKDASSGRLEFAEEIKDWQKISELNAGSGC